MREDQGARRRRGGRADLHTLVGAYVMDAVTDDDRARFEQHLAGCETCRAEVRGMREATARLAAAAQVTPRAELREQTMLAAGLIRQLPPAAAAAARRPARWRLGAPRGWLPRVAVASAAVLAVVAVLAAVVMGVGMHGAEHRLDVAQGRSQAVASVLGAPDATMLTAQVSSGGSATVVMSHRASALVFTAAHLPPLASSQSYELWVMSPAGPRPAGMLPATQHGMIGPMLIFGLTPGDKVGLTIEPASGSARPTSPTILMLSLGS